MMRMKLVEETVHKICVAPAKKEMETIHLDGSTKPYDPFDERRLKNPTTDMETMTHLLKASLGSGILSMPYAFKCAGLSMGLLATVLTAFICTYCSYILVKCAHSLYFRVKIHTMSYADVAEVAFANGPAAVRPYSKFSRVMVMIALFVSYFGAVSCYTVIAGENFQEVIEHYTKVNINIRYYIASVLPILLPLAFIPNLKALVPFSFAANVLIVLGLGITVYFLIFGTAQEVAIRYLPEKWADLSFTFSITVFAMEAIGLMMPLENNMKNPTHFTGICGVLNRGMTVVSLIYIIIGVIGYLKFGDRVAANITKNLPIEHIVAQVAKVSIGVSVLLSYVLQFFVCLEILWNLIKDYCAKSERLYNSLCRIGLVFFSVLLAVAIPTIGPFASLIGALCFSFLGIIFPVFIDVVTYWEKQSKSTLLLRSAPVLLFGVLALCFGTYTSMLDIIDLYSGKNLNTTMANNGSVSA
ncbi:proton-coupled amino acid transporter-like protein pathetic isoform X2 [Planococcus citri]|uniref:proton-coupled amino acid transporter-like protein pathetic isoform X2 n=1 Tax=Planococcus citri TaxID=170843 RepID=UPI0031FA3289